MYAWTRPRIAVPAHGEPLHLSEHATFARGEGVPTVVEARNGTMVRLAPGPSAIIDDVPAGRVYKDGDLIIDSSDRAVAERRKLAFAGIVSVAIALEQDGTIAGDAIIDAMGLPAKTGNGELFTDFIAGVVEDTLGSLPKGKRRDPDAVETAVTRAIRSTVNNLWGKKPACHVLVVEV